jgi:ABC-2 type transport system ATP-binding protein
VQTEDEAGAIACAQRQGFTPRHYGRDLAFWIPEHLELKDIIERFDGITLNSISRQPIRLEHIYVEVTGSRSDSLKCQQLFEIKNS